MPALCLIILLVAGKTCTQHRKGIIAFVKEAGAPFALWCAASFSSASELREQVLPEVCRLLVWQLSSAVPHVGVGGEVRLSPALQVGASSRGHLLAAVTASAL